MAEYLAKLLNERHPYRRVIEDVLEEYLFNINSDQARQTGQNLGGGGLQRAIQDSTKGGLQ